jgi:YggT family protein
MIVAILDLVLRTLVVAALLYACVVALTGWAVRAHHLSPFGPWPRFVRRMSDPILRKVEHRVIQAGGSPQDAPLWLIGAVVLGGLVLLSFAGWIFRSVARFGYLTDAGPAAWLRMLVGVAFSLTMAALFVRVIASWFGLSRYRRWMRPVFFLTDWIVEPIRRVLPPVGMIDFSPMIAWLVLWLLRGFLLGLL